MSSSSLATPCRFCGEPTSHHCDGGSEPKPDENGVLLGPRVADNCTWWRCSGCGAYGDDTIRRMVVPVGRKPQEDDSGRVRMTMHYETVDYD